MTRIVIDACCLINLAAADAFSTWLPQLGLTCVLPQAVVDEALFLRTWNDQGEPSLEPIDLKPHIASRLFEVVAPVGAQEIGKLAIQQGMKTLRVVGLEKVKDGVSTLEQTLLVTSSAV